MADNEAKARQKMTEGRKKLQGGGGFFSKVFGGGGGSGEAADLFIQVNSSSVAPETGQGLNVLRNNGGDDEVEEEDYYDEETSSEIECGHNGCQFIASNLLEFEEHYAQHSFQCSECGIGFDTSHRLEIHQDEKHNPFFQIQVSRQPDVAHFRCLHPTCELQFTNSRTRDEHSRIVHFIHGDSSRRRRANDSVVASVLSSAMSRMCMAEEDIGWSTTPERKIRKATRRKTDAPETHGI